MTANEVTESQEESDDTTSLTINYHRSVTENHGDKKVKIRRESEREIREENTDGGGVEVFRETTGDKTPKEAKRNGGDETKEETENGDGDANGSGHGI
jgi:hypothetical protein